MRSAILVLNKTSHDDGVEIYFLVSKLYQEFHQGRIISPVPLSALRAQFIEFLAETFWSQKKVPLSRGQADLAHISGQGGEHAIHVSSVFYPTCDPVHGEGRSQIMQSGVVYRPVMSNHARMLAKSLVVAADGSGDEGLTISLNEEACAREVPPALPVYISLQNDL